MKRISEYLLLGGLLLFLFLKGIVPAWNEVHSDFANYYVSSKLVVVGAPLEQLYNDDWFQQKKREYAGEIPGKFSPFPPITAWVLLPLTSFELLSAQRVFLVVNLIFIFMCILLLKQITNWEYLHSALFVLAGGLSVANNIAFGQLYIIMTAAILLALILYEKNYPLTSGLILGVFIALKYFPIVFVAGFFFLAVTTKTSSGSNPQPHRDGKVIISALVTLLALILLQFIFFGKTVMQEFLTHGFLPHLDSDLSSQGPYSFLYQSWDNLFRNLFVPDPQFNPSPLLDWPAGKTTMKVALLVVISVSALVGLFMYKDAGLKIKTAIFLSLPALAALVMLPASATYHFMLLIPPLVILLRENWIDKNWTIGIIALYGLVGFIPYGMAFRLASSWGMFFAYPRLWLISGIYLLVLVGLWRRRGWIIAS